MRKIVIILMLIPAVILLYCSDGEQETSKQESETKEVVKESDSLTITLYGQAGKHVLELTEQSHIVEYVEGSEGAFITAIDSIKAGNGYSWLISVNDSLIDVAADRYVTSDSDTVKWHLRKY